MDGPEQAEGRVKLLANRVALGPLPADDIAEMSGSLWLPPSAVDSQRYMIGEVAAVGPESELLPGLRVVHRQFHFLELPDDLRAFWEHDILAVLTKGEDGMYTIVPLRNQIVVEELPPEKHTGLIHLIEDQQEKSLRGTVLAVGPGLLKEEGGRWPMETQEGDIVVYAKFAGTKLAIDGTEVLILGEDKVLAKLVEQVGEV